MPAQNRHGIIRADQRCADVHAGATGGHSHRRLDFPTARRATSHLLRGAAVKRLLALLVLAALVVGGAMLWPRGDRAPSNVSARQPAEAPPLVVSVATAVVKPVPIEISTIGTVNVIASVAVKSRIDGEITEVHIQDGQAVKEGDLLFSIDSRSIRTELTQAEANLARDQALLENARRNVARLSKLASKDYVAKQSMDEAATNAQSLEASVRGDEAAVEAARVQLTYTEIRAPMDARAGTVQLPRGNLVRANDSAPLVVLNQIRPIYVAFSVPQSDLPTIRVAQADGPLPVGVTVPGDPDPPLQGEVTFIDNAVDESTGTIQLKATFENAEERLWPGQYVTVTLTTGIDATALVVPDQALQRGQDGTHVFVVQEDSTVDLRDVSVARSRQGEAIIIEGLSAGDRVVVEGQLRLTPGARVDPRPHAPATADESSS
jgi:multidrug efflux system membrane fusion protein